MKVKPVPAAPDSLESLWRAQKAVPLVPATEDTCLSRLLARLDLPSRDEARRWLTFLHGLDLIRQTRGGFVRTREQPAEVALSESFTTGVYGVSELLGILASHDQPVPAETVFEEFLPHVPPWERHHAPATWRDTWRTRVNRLLEWLTLLDLIEHTTDGYRSLDYSPITES